MDKARPDVFPDPQHFYGLAEDYSKHIVLTIYPFDIISRPESPTVAIGFSYHRPCPASRAERDAQSWTSAVKADGRNRARIRAVQARDLANSGNLPADQRMLKISTSAGSQDVGALLLPREDLRRFIQLLRKQERSQGKDGAWLYQPGFWAREGVRKTIDQLAVEQVPFVDVLTLPDEDPHVPEVKDRKAEIMKAYGG